MRKFAYQYVAMGASLAFMFFATAYLRSVAPSSYVAQLATFLVLLGWISPFEVALGNLIFRSAGGATTGHALTATDGGILVRILGVGAAFGVAFAIYPNGGVAPGGITMLAVGCLFTVRLVEYVSRTNLLLYGQGQTAQMIVNGITALKWSLSISLFASGFTDFVGLALCHMGLGILSAAILMRRIRVEGTRQSTAQRSAAVLTIRDDMLSVLSVAAGVLSFQIDKLAVGFYRGASDFGQYVLLYTLAVIGPYVLSPVFTLFQQHLAASGTSMRGDGNHASILRLAALVVTALTIPVLVIVSAARPDASGFAQQQMGVFAAASYLSCLAHIYYLRYQVAGRVDLVLAQNLVSLACSIGVMVFVVLTKSQWFSVVVLAAAGGQYLFGVARDVSRGFAQFRVVDIAGGVILIPYLMLYGGGALSLKNVLVITMSAVLVAGAGAWVESRGMRMSARNYVGLMLTFVRAGR